MKYLPKETCEYLVSLGCVSESGKWWDFRPTVQSPDECIWLVIPKRLLENMDCAIPAFSLEDILRRHNLEKLSARKNCSIWELAYQILDDTLNFPDAWLEKVAKFIHR